MSETTFRRGRTDRPRRVPPGEVVWFETDLEEGQLQVTYQARRGRCYELAADAIAFGDVPTGTLLVHGTIDGGPGTLGRIGHAWLLLPDGRLWEPIFATAYDHLAWTEWADARVERVYTRLEAMRQMQTTGNYGRWHESDYR